MAAITVKSVWLASSCPCSAGVARADRATASMAGRTNRFNEIRLRKSQFSVLARINARVRQRGGTEETNEGSRALGDAATCAPFPGLIRVGTRKRLPHLGARLATRQAGWFLSSSRLGPPQNGRGQRRIRRGATLTAANPPTEF